MWAEAKGRKVPTDSEGEPTLFCDYFMLIILSTVVRTWLLPFFFAKRGEFVTPLATVAKDYIMKSVTGIHSTAELAAKAGICHYRGTKQYAYRLGNILVVAL